MTAYTVLRFAKLKSWGAVGGAGSHNARLRQTTNADPEALVKNRFLIGSPGDDLAAMCQARLQGRKIRKNAVLAVEGVMSASPEYFRPDCPERYGHYDPARLEAWVKASMNWLQKKYGDRVMSAVLHLDEATPHLQFLILPLDDKGHLNCRHLFGGSRQVMADLQTEYAKAVAHLGLSRGRAGSKAQHQDVAQYYAATQNLNHTPAPPVPTMEDIEVPEPPGTMARLKDKNLTDYARATAIKAIEEHTAKLAPTLKTLTDRNDVLTAEVKRLTETQERLKADNARLSLENAKFKEEAKKMRGLPLDLILTRMFGATEKRDSVPQGRRFELPDGAVIVCTPTQWLEPLQGAVGKGAINLVMHLSGYGQEQYQQAVRDMAAIFGEQETSVTLGRHLSENASQELRAIRQASFQKPPLSDTHWPAVREYLLDQVKLPAPIVDQAYTEGLIYSDNRRNCVFLRERDSGAFIINTKGRTFARSLGHEDVPFALPGSDKALYLTDTPMEALSLKALHPDSTILASGEIPARDTLQPYLEGKTQIFLAQGRDKAVEEYARHLARHYPTVKRLLPKGQSWHEEWLLHKEEKERASVEMSQERTPLLQSIQQKPSMTLGMGR